MDRIIVTTIGTTDYELQEEYASEESAQKGTDPDKREVNFYNTKYRKRTFKKKQMKND